MENTPRKSFSLSKPKNSPDIPPLLEVKKKEEEDHGKRTPILGSCDNDNDSTLESSPTSFCVPLSASSLSGEESDSENGSQKRDSSYDFSGDGTTMSKEESHIQKHKKLKRRNISLYASVENDVL